MRAAACGIPSGSTPRSKRCEASLRIPTDRAEWRTVIGSKAAASRRTRVVPSLISLRSPPITPAIASPPSESVIISTSSERERFTPSRVRKRSPSRARRTTIRLATRSASNG